MTQQTALETFYEQIAEILPFSVDSVTAIKLYQKYQEANQMEKVQIQRAYIENRIVDSEQYYTQTYNQKK